MPRTKRTKPQPERLAPVSDEILDQFTLDRPMTAEDIDTAGRRLKKALMERMLGAELSHHLGYPPGGARPDDTTNHRNGRSEKRVLTDDGPVTVEIPRDRDGTFEPQLIPKHARRLAGFDEKVLALYGRGLPVREIQKFLAEIYGNRGLAGSDQRGHRRGGGGGDRVAGAPARAALSGRVL
jgi:transposase-like protein